MNTYDVRMSDGQAEKWKTVEADDLDAADDAARELAGEWAESGDWGDDGAIVVTRYEIFAPRNHVDDLASGVVETQIEPDHAALLRRAGAPADCDHEWASTVEVDGGCDENPGVFSRGGTTMVFSSHCARCGVRRVETRHGAQRDPGQSDSVKYTYED